MAAIVLATLNARWTHASLGLRCLHAQLGDLRHDAAIEEFTLATPLPEALARLLAHGPRVVGLGVYVWNVARTAELVRMLRQAAPQVRIVLGGPEVSHETEDQPIVARADHVVRGPGEVTFARLAAQLLRGPRPLQKVLDGEQAPLAALASPYPLYTDDDLARRHVYVEASRGCPFRCAFCLSALDRSAQPFPLPALLDALAALHARGARRFRFVDRTFNLKVEAGRAILGFFLQRLRERPDDPTFAHFELVPDRLPELLRESIAAFAPGTLQLEIGVQSWDPAVLAAIDRRQDNERAETNLRWLRTHTHAHLHVDLIAGLPGETLAGFGAGFDRLAALDPHEIQVGILKRLRGAPLARRAAALGLVFDPDPPYALREGPAMPAADLHRLGRFARVWDLFGNSGRFARTRPLLLGERPFGRVMAFADALHAAGAPLHRWPLEARADALHDWLVTAGGCDAAAVRERLQADYLASGARGRPAFLPRGLAGGRPAPPAGAARRVPGHRAAAAAR
jgi:hypothetical protein